MEPVENPQTPVQLPESSQPEVVVRYTPQRSVWISVVVLILLGAGGFWWQVKNNQSNSDRNPDGSIASKQNSGLFGNDDEQGNENDASSDVSPLKAGAVAWNTIGDSEPVRTTEPLNFYNVPVQVFKVGDIQEGEYRGKILALGVAKDAYDFFRLDEGQQLSEYVFFVAESDGVAVAWDPTFVHYPDARCPNSSSVQGCQKYYEINEKLGLTDNNQVSLVTLIPPEFKNELFLTTSEKRVRLGLSGYLTRLKASADGLLRVDQSQSGFQILKKVDPQSSERILPVVSYFIFLPIASMPVAVEPDFVDENYVPQITWTLGEKSSASYRFGVYAYGWEDCYDGIPQNQLRLHLIQTGVTKSGTAVYEANPKTEQGVYRCLHEKTKRYVYNPITDEGAYEQTIAYEDFVSTHPMFFWSHQYGDLMAFIRSDVVPAAEKAKPVVYLYPEKNERVRVEVAPLGGFTVTDPAYEDGWVVDATPEGAITNTKDGKQYPYLFWEGGKEGIVETPKEGFVVAKADVEKTLTEKLKAFGLRKQERVDFLEFWVPKLSQAPYYFLTFISRSEIDRVSPMTVTPAPNTVIRVLLDYKPLENLSDAGIVAPLPIFTTERKGFTIVEWGGILRD